jgi:hypothetical protein
MKTIAAIALETEPGPDHRLACEPKVRADMNSPAADADPAQNGALR